MSNLPPGVSGFEYQIAGPSSEYDEEREVACEVEECRFSGDVTGTVIVWDRTSATYWWECPFCGVEHNDEEEAEEEAPEPWPYEPDPDDLW